MPILPMDPRATFTAHRGEIVDAITRVLDGGRYILGPETSAFEEEFAAYVGVSHCVGVGSGTEALHVGLRALGIEPGDAVLTVAHTAVATVAAIEMAGALPILVDVDPETFAMSAESLEVAIKAFAGSHRLRAVIPVHLYGHPADMPAILAVARRYDLLVLEDGAQAHGAELHGTRIGQFGDAAAFSFYPTKNLGAFGDGGAIVTADAGIAERARSLREYGWQARYVSAEPGVNSRLDEVQAAILRVKLAHLDIENGRRREIARAYGESLNSVGVELPRERPGAKHVYHLYVVRCRERERLRQHLVELDVQTLVHYPVPVHLQPAYEGRLPIVPGGLPVTEQLRHEILSLPMHPYLADEDVQAVCEAVNNFR